MTHGHVDHMFCVAPVAGGYDATAWIHPDDRHLLADPMAGMSPETARMMLGGDYTWEEPDDVRELTDLQELELAGVRFVVDHTPGHTEGSVTFRSPYPDVDEVSEVMFSGDLLFAGSIGRTDLPGGDHPTMLHSLATKVLPLADDIVVLPGHGEQTTIGRERATNPFLPRPSRHSADRMTDKPTPLSGFPELLPEHRAVERQVIATPVPQLRAARLRQHRDPCGRADRPALPRAARSTRRSTCCAGCRRTTARGDSGLGLHFDLTVPFARYVLEHSGKLEFPFRRYQIQPAWRGERPQEGRYRQFTQADIDVVGRDELPFHHDVEVVRVMVEALDALPLPNLLRPGQQPQADPGLLPRPRHPRRHRRDPRDRQARQAAGRGGRRAAGRGGRRQRRAGAALPRPRQIRVSDTCFVERVRALGVEDELLDEGLAELAAVIDGCASAVNEQRERRGQPAHRARARLLHRHRLRDLHGRLRAAEVGRRRRPVRRARQRRPDDVPRRRRLASASLARWSRCSPTASSSPSRQGAQRRAGRARRRGVARRQ